MPSIPNVGFMATEMDIHPVAFGDFALTHSERKPEVIKGLIRRGETGILVSSSKAGKSHLVAQMAVSVSTGRMWLGMDTVQSRVLIVDNELSPGDIAFRLRNITHAMQVNDHEVNEQIEIISLRGSLIDVEHLSSLIREIESETYGLIVLDALYRLWPARFHENDNADVTRVFNFLDCMAARAEAAVIAVHHASKGDQGSKHTLDVGAGAGAMSRAADTIITIREHENDGHCVLETTTRSFSSPPPISIAWRWPVWQSTTLAPTLRQRKGRTELLQQKRDDEADKMILARLTKPRSVSQLRTSTGMGDARVRRALDRLVSMGRISAKFKKSRQTGKRAEYFQATEPTCTETCTETCMNH